jgi:tetratricopeptide (TPR) repeat protein
VGGEGVALARLKSSDGTPSDSEGTSAVEAFVGPDAWRGLAQTTDGPRADGVVLTGQLDPPVSGHGTLRLLAFEADSGRARAEVDEPLDEARAGASIVRALDALWTEVGGELGALRSLRDLAWEPLESVLRAEQSALFDPELGGPRDGLAALLHLGRAISEAPQAPYPSQRLASFALESLSFASVKPTIAAATKRALLRALDDAPMQVELAEALATLDLRMGRPREAELHLQTAIELAPARPTLYLLLAQALRAQRDLRRALAAIDVGLGIDSSNATLRADRGELLAEAGDIVGAAKVWREVLAHDPVQPTAFIGLALASLRSGDTPSAQRLVDSALESRRASPDVLRRAANLALETEPDGIARAARVARLCQRTLESRRSDEWALLVLAQAMRALGDRTAARARLEELGASAPGSAALAESVLIHIGMENPVVELEIVSVMRAVHTASAADLDALASRARQIATLHNAWVGALAAAVAARRQGRWNGARDLLDQALKMAPGAAAAHAEMSLVQRALGDDRSADEHRRAGRELEIQTLRGLSPLPGQLWAEGRRAEIPATFDLTPAPKPWGVRLQRWWTRPRGAP